MIGRWLCKRNRHRKGWIETKDPTVLRVLFEQGIAPPRVTAISCPTAQCERCGAPLRLSTRRILGWESFGAW